ncbi:MAG TPA: hypothetical protein VNE39_01090 [Planctomycetota bacterium]|nr:hypothetical protein [Planctomycetota bacterium]
MRGIIRTALVLLAIWAVYTVGRSIYRGVRRAMGLPVEEPGQEQRLFRQAVIGTFTSLIVPFAYLHLDPQESRPALLLLMLPAFFGAGVLWVSGVKGIVGLYRREPRLLLHPTVFLTCVAASFSLGMTALVAVTLLGRILP